MTTIVPTAFARLIDDAAVFPPSELPLAKALEEHRRHREAWYGPLVGPLLCRASALTELETLVRDDDPVEIGVIVDSGTTGILEAVDAVAGNDRLVLRGVEIALRGDALADNARRVVAALDAALGGPDDEEPGYVELPRLPGWLDALAVVADSGYRAKLRTGGAELSDHPSPAELAAFVVACLDQGVAFKLTAGLHHAVRHPTSTGQAEHGFLNVIAGVRDALDGAGQDDVAATLSIAEPQVIAARVADLTADRLGTVRRWFASFGSCSIDEPVTELVGLGLTTEPDQDE